MVVIKGGPSFMASFHFLAQSLRGLIGGWAYQLSLRIGNAEFLIDCLWI